MRRSPSVTEDNAMKLAMLSGAFALALAMLTSPLGSGVAEAAQCRIGTRWVDCTSRELWRQRDNYIPGCTGVAPGTQVSFRRADGKMITHTCSGKQTEQGRRGGPPRR